jgi:hypothetical protein
MKKITIAGTGLLIVLVASWCIAGQEIPNLVGAWEVKSEGAVMVRGDKPGKTTHWEVKQTSLTAEVNITKQNGRVVYGTFKSSRVTENLIGVIGYDNKTFHFADEDGFADGKIIGNDSIEFIYRHVTQKDTVAAVGVWTRKK